jgi:hypothetical protein
MWVKSSYSNLYSNCVEVEAAADGEGGRVVRVRDSKDPFGPVLAITADERSAFTAGRKAGEFDGAWRWAFLVMRDKNTSLAASRLVSPCATRSTTPCSDLVRLAQPCCAPGALSWRSRMPAAGRAARTRTVSRSARPGDR